MAVTCFHVGNYRVVQLNFTPEIEVFYVLLHRSLPIYDTTSLKKNMEYFISGV